jgi:hypothetical protein
MNNISMGSYNPYGQRTFLANATIAFFFYFSERYFAH